MGDGGEVEWKEGRDDIEDEATFHWRNAVQNVVQNVVAREWRGNLLVVEA